jgi:hypothetical protein
MTEYFLGLIAFAFFGAVIFSLAPDGISKRYIRLLCGLCSIGCIAFPIFNLIGDGEEIGNISELFEASFEVNENSVEIYNNSINNATVKNAEEELKNDIIKATSAKYNDIGVKIILAQNSDEFYIDRVVVYIYPSGYDLEPKRISEICRGKLGIACDIIYK